MEIKYRYLAILKTDEATPDRPSGMIRTWTDENGREQEEIFTSKLTWEKSHLLSFMARPTYDEYVEVDESVLAPFIERVKKIHGTNQ